MRRALPLIAIVSLLVIVAVIAAIPAFANEPDHHTLHTQEVNLKKPHKGAWSEQITSAAVIPQSGARSRPAWLTARVEAAYKKYNQVPGRVTPTPPLKEGGSSSTTVGTSRFPT